MNLSIIIDDESISLHKKQEAFAKYIYSKGLFPELPPYQRSINTIFKRLSERFNIFHDENSFNTNRKHIEFMKKIMKEIEKGEKK